MEAITSSGIRIEKLDENYFREVYDMIDSTLCSARPDDPDELQKWVRKDKTARMAIALALSDEVLKSVRNTVTSLEMWEKICNLH